MNRKYLIKKQKTKHEQRTEINEAMKKYKGPISKIEELDILSKDETEFSMRCTESGLTTAGEDRSDLMGFK